MIAGRYNKREKSLSELSTAHGERLILADLDVGSDEGVKAAVCAVQEQGCETVNLLINNAAILGDGFMDPSSAEAEQRLEFIDVEGNSWPW